MIKNNTGAISPLVKQRGFFRSGTSGLVLSEPNKVHFPKEYQDKSRLEYYSSKFNSIEINSSFYKIPRCQTYGKWSAIVPEDFQFSVKLWKGITHNGEFDFEDKELEKFFSGVDCLGKKKGCLLVQFPSGSRIDLIQLEKLLVLIKKFDPGNHWRLAVEFRNKRWYEGKVCQVLNEYGVSIVLHDMPDSSTDQLLGKPSFVYLRFHGEKGDYRGSYNTEFLNAKAKEISAWMNQGLDVYAYFNNTIGDAADNLKLLNQMISNSEMPVPD